MIIIIDYKIGNLGSIRNMLRRIEYKDVLISSDATEIEKADKLILPGVGSFDNGMVNLSKCGLIPILNERVLFKKVPILGICLGMQLFSQKSEEGKSIGLGWIDAQTVKFKPKDNLKIPHMGWNTINIKRKNPFLKDLDPDSRFYFVHSYHVVCNEKENILATTFYGEEFVSIVQRENILGVQFHPEKSHRFGMELLKNFIEI